MSNYIPLLALWSYRVHTRTSSCLLVLMCSFVQNLLRINNFGDIVMFYLSSSLCFTVIVFRRANTHTQKIRKMFFSESWMSKTSEFAKIPRPIFFYKSLISSPIRCTLYKFLDCLPSLSEVNSPCILFFTA